MDTGRLGLVVSKKCEKTSVGRNRIKRLIRESFRHHQTQLSGLDIVVLARPGITKRTNSEIFADLHKHWGNVARCKKSSST
jgi:ribonuclease P protein component